MLSPFFPGSCALIRHEGSRYTFSKWERIRRSAEYKRVYRFGTRYHSKHFTLIVSPREQGCSRLGITASKKIGNAVRRNRVKRVIRELFRKNKLPYTPFQDYVFMAKKGADELTYGEVLDEIKPFFDSKNNC